MADQRYREPLDRATLVAVNVMDLNVAEMRKHVEEKRSKLRSLGWSGDCSFEEDLVNAIEAFQRAIRQPAHSSQSAVPPLSSEESR
jgi:hypothetical protein